MVKPASPGQPVYKHRVKLTITPTIVHEESWQAEFATVPIVSSGPLYELPTLREPQRGPGPPPSMAGVPHLAELHERAFEAQVANYKMQLAERRLMPGLVSAKKGTLTLGYDGTCADFSTFTSLPIMAGSIWSAPLVILPPEESKSSYSNKQMLYRLGDEKDPEVPDAWLINAWVVEPDKDGLVPLKRSIEFAAGDHSGLKIDLSGDGTAVFDRDRGVAKSGTIDFTAKTSIYRGVVDGYQLKIGFQLLEDWQQAVFDLYLVPNEKSLDKENLARMTAKQMSYTLSLLNYSKPGSKRNSNDLMGLNLYAPLPVNSQLYQVMQREQKRMRSGDSTGGSSWYQHEINLALSRWNVFESLGLRFHEHGKHLPAIFKSKRGW